MEKARVGSGEEEEIPGREISTDNAAGWKAHRETETTSASSGGSLKCVRGVAPGAGKTGTEKDPPGASSQEAGAQ